MYSLMRKKPELSMSWSFYDPFWSFFCQLRQYLSQNWASDGHFDVSNMPKSYLDQKLWHKTQLPVFCNFVKKNTDNLWLINGHFTTISGHFLANYIKIFQKTEIQTVILRCFVGLNLNWIKSYGITLVQISFFSCLKMHHFRASLTEWNLTPPKETSFHISKWLCTNT